METQTPPLALTVHHDIHIPLKEAKIRGIDESLSRLVVEGRVETLAESLCHSCPQNEAIFVHAIGEFVSLRKLQPELSKRGIGVLAEGLLKVTDSVQLRAVFDLWKAEQLVVFFGTDSVAKEVMLALPKLQPKWWKFSQEGYESPFLKQSHLVSPIVFFSPTRSSLEVLGDERTIQELLSRMAV